MKRRVLLMNALMMPTAGLTYHPREIDKEAFKSILLDAARDGRLKSYIGYQTTADHIKNIVSIDIPMNREPTEACSGDLLLVCKLKYRLNDPNLKHSIRLQSNIADEDYCYYAVDVT
ncbi:MAG: DUF1874 domain-containing protein [Acidobacteria bacterium]|jgi:hypothetical protein|nr:MAG: DUF1874 domain-containing protein [Acidobacteriota bacterium]